MELVRHRYRATVRVGGVGTGIDFHLVTVTVVIEVLITVRDAVIIGVGQINAVTEGLLPLVIEGITVFVLQAIVNAVAVAVDGVREQALVQLK